MTAKEHVLAIYPNAIAHKSQRIALDAKPNEFMIEIIVFPDETKVATLSTTFCSPEVIEDMAWEMAWQNIQQEMLNKLEEDPEDRRRMEEQEQEYREYQEYYERRRQEEMEWEQREYEELEERAMARKNLKL